ncbi:MAG: hypothetical protein IPK15_00710 [Verrucomicrobia bacterium]|nr:hypothetical protein [Verrucomicrobiota bacterium]
MNFVPQMLTDLRGLQTICRELLSLAERESQLLRSDASGAINEATNTRRSLLPRLNEALDKARQHRVSWQGLNAADRAAQPEVGFLVRQVQDLIMRVILLDRDNEQGLLRRGLIPAREIPAAQRQRPHFVADLYRRQQS